MGPVTWRAGGGIDPGAQIKCLIDEFGAGPPSAPVTRTVEPFGVTVILSPSSCGVRSDYWRLLGRQLGGQLVEAGVKDALNHLNQLGCFVVADTAGFKPGEPLDPRAFPGVGLVNAQRGQVIGDGKGCLKEAVAVAARGVVEGHKSFDECFAVTSGEPSDSAALCQLAGGHRAQPIG